MPASSWPPDAQPDRQLAIEQKKTEQQERTEQLREKERTGRVRAFLNTVPILATMVRVLIALFRALQSQAQYRRKPRTASRAPWRCSPGST
ncbi:hypothetical protein [Deinococcus sp.]|uniref:hypothetical protein n=1 Tax=Deinococcus sp. TaxID=47478 RepID=UPI002869C321|nr:hypothetical protein [Deinococcus sp.]